jgi:hypothetical protein
VFILQIGILFSSVNEEVLSKSNSQTSSYINLLHNVCSGRTDPALISNKIDRPRNPTRETLSMFWEDEMMIIK